MSHLEAVLSAERRYTGCACGFDLRPNASQDVTGSKHAIHHLKWHQGLERPDTTPDGPMLLVNIHSSMAEKWLAYQMMTLHRDEARADGYQGIVVPVHPDQWHVRDIVVLAFDEGRAIAVASLWEEAPYALKLNTLWVAAGHRRRGIGTALIQDIAEAFQTTPDKMEAEAPVAPEIYRIVDRLGMLKVVWCGSLRDPR